MNRSILASVVASLLILACSAPESGTHTARDVPDEPAAVSPAPPADGRGAETPIADRMRSLDKTIYKVSVDDLPAIGSPNAPLTVVLFSDYECSYCRKLEPHLAQLRADHGSDVRIVLAPKPLPFHKQAKPAALAVLAAAEQGKLEPMHRALVALDGKLDDASLTSAARDAGLDLARFDADRQSAKVEKILAKAEALAERFSVQGTPTTFFNGRRITGMVPDVVHQLGEEQLAVGRGLIKQGMQPARVYETIIAQGAETAAPDPSVTFHRPLTSEQMTEMSKCWAGTKTPVSVELTSDAAGKVIRVATEPAEHTACVTKAASAWTLKKGEGESKMKFMMHP